MYLFNVFQVPNVAWQSYLQLSLDFEPWVLVSRVTYCMPYDSTVPPRSRYPSLLYCHSLLYCWMLVSDIICYMLCMLY